MIGTRVKFRQIEYVNPRYTSLRVVSTVYRRSDYEIHGWEVVSDEELRGVVVSHPQLSGEENFLVVVKVGKNFITICTDILTEDNE